MLRIGASYSRLALSNFRFICLVVLLIVVKDERMMQALKYLAETDEPAAAAKALMVGLEEQKRTVISIAMLDSKEKAANMKEVDARTSSEYIAWAGDYKKSVYEYETLRNKRITEALIVDAWRSCNSNKKKGNVI